MSEMWAPGVRQEMIDRKRTARMDAIDGMPPAIRELVHEYGFNVVKAFMDCGVTKAKQIKHLVETTLDEFSPTRGSFSRQGPRTEVVDITRK